MLLESLLELGPAIHGVLDLGVELFQLVVFSDLDLFSVVLLHAGVETGVDGEAVF